MSAAFFHILHQAEVRGPLQAQPLPPSSHGFPSSSWAAKRPDLELRTRDVDTSLAVSWEIKSPVQAKEKYLRCPAGSLLCQTPLILPLNLQPKSNPLGI